VNILTSKENSAVWRAGDVADLRDVGAEAPVTKRLRPGQAKPEICIRKVSNEPARLLASTAYHMHQAKTS